MKQLKETLEIDFSQKSLLFSACSFHDLIKPDEDNKHFFFRIKYPELTYFYVPQGHIFLEHVTLFINLDWTNPMQVFNPRSVEQTFSFIFLILYWNILNLYTCMPLRTVLPFFQHEVNLKTSFESFLIGFTHNNSNWSADSKYTHVPILCRPLVWSTQNRIQFFMPSVRTAYVVSEPGTASNSRAQRSAM